MLTKREFNIRFLLATDRYRPKVARQLLRECREDVELFGWEYAQNKWAKLVEMPKEGACPACGSTDWWQRPDGGWVCGWCHPKPR